MANICKNLEQNLKELNMSMSLTNSRDFLNDNVEPKDADEIVVYDYNNGIDFKTFRLPKKKLVDIEWIMTKYNAEKTFVSFVDDFKKLLHSKGYKNSLNCYPTTYGIGIFVAFGHRDCIQQSKKDVDDLLKQIGIAYTNERSDAGYVFRYKISKKKENIEKIKQFAEKL